MKLDDTDRALLVLLQEDARQPNAQLAERLSISASACWRRVRALEEAGVISRYAAVIDPPAIGLGFEAIVHVRLKRHDSEALERFITGVQRREEVVECYATTGEDDYHLRVLCRDIEAYNGFLETFLFVQPAVNSAHTNVVLRRIKAQSALRGG
jgi:DNA-binding Lrp family transcriptional regulator